MIKLTNENYYSPEANWEWMSCSQFKSFMKCEHSALAELRGEFERESTSALLIGSYIDSHFEGTLDIFKAQHPEIFTRSGALKSEYEHAEYIIQRIERDKKFMQYMSGEKQKIFTGRIAGIPFKIKVDSFHPSCIVDLKIMKDFKSIWNTEKQQREHFIVSWGYHYQGAIYQEIVRQNIGKTLPFYIAAASKEKEPKLKLYYLPNDFLAETLNEVANLVTRFQKIKKGSLIPQRCEDCNYCRFTEELSAPINFLEECEVYEVE